MALCNHTVHAPSALVYNLKSGSFCWVVVKLFHGLNKGKLLGAKFDSK